jgi:hypothetical protein
MTTLALTTSSHERVVEPATRQSNSCPPRMLRGAAPSFALCSTTRDVRVSIASEVEEWEEAFQLVGDSYRSRGYVSPDTTGPRFTAYHALPDTATFVAKCADQVIATLSLVPDNTLLGLPMECIYGPEIAGLRQSGARLAEVTSLADRGLGLREFVPVFVGLMRILGQYTLSKGGGMWVITINPRHRTFYTKVMGFVPLGPCRAYPSVQNHPAEAYLLTPQLMKDNAPDMHRQIFGDALPEEVLEPRRMPAHLARYFGAQAGASDRKQIEQVLNVVADGRFPLREGVRRW